MAAWGIEARVPFLGKEFLEYAMGFDPIDKMCSDNRAEKYILRKAFEGMIKTRGLDAMGKAGMHIAWNRSSVTNKKRKNILVSTVADKGVMTLMVQIYCSGCMRWVQIPFYSPKKLCVILTHLLSLN